MFTVAFAGQAMVGAWASFTVTVKEQVAVLPEASVTRNELVVVPIGNVAPLARPESWATVWPGQLSEDPTL